MGDHWRTPRVLPSRPQPGALNLFRRRIDHRALAAALSIALGLAAALLLALRPWP